MKVLWHRIMAIIASLGLLAMLWYAFEHWATPRLSTSGYLGLLNIIIIGYLVVLGIRHLFILLFAELEQARREKIPDPQNYPPISIIVPAFNEDVVIAASIQKLLQIDYPEFEIIVIDDGSTDATFDKALNAAKGHPNVRVFRKQNGGKWAALNFGIDRANHPFVFCMDADSHVEKSALKMGIRHFTEDSVAAVAGSVFVLNQKRLLGKFQALEYMTGLNFFKAAQSYLGSVTIIPGPSGLFRRSAVNEIGGYQGDTFAEDCDISLRLLMDGRRIVYEPYMEVRTEVPVGIISLVKQRYRWTRGILQATKKNFKFLLRPLSNPAGFSVIVYLIFESMLLPLLNISVAILSLAYAGFSKDFSLFSLWLVELTILDLSTVLFSLADSRWSLWLLPLTAINRLTYAFGLDVARLLATLEELGGVRMDWGKLRRTGEGGQS